MPGEAAELFAGGGWAVVNGTLWSAPQYAALLAETYEYRNVRFTPTVEIPYYIFATSPGAFIDVASGNDQYGGTSPYFSAAPGYDNASGLGVPLGSPSANTICPNRTPALRRRPSIYSSFGLGALSSGVSLAPITKGLSNLAGGRRSSHLASSSSCTRRPASRPMNFS